jgi:hypothetical protein
MSELTHDHLNALADRLEASYRRECDQMRVDLKGDWADLKDTVKVQNGRIGKSEMAIGELREDARILLHDFRGHLEMHKVPPSTLVDETGSRHTKGFTAGVMATLLVIATVGHSVWDWAVQYLPGLMKSWKQP